jgi:hypothetical protein
MVGLPSWDCIVEGIGKGLSYVGDKIGSAYSAVKGFALTPAGQAVFSAVGDALSFMNAVDAIKHIHDVEDAAGREAISQTLSNGKALAAQSSAATSGGGVADGVSKQVGSPNNAEEDDWGVYAEGQHNVVYILVTEEGKKELQKQGTSGQDIADQINANMKSLGLDTKAVYWTGDPRYFDGNKLSSTASVAVIGGNRDDVSKFYREELDSWFADKDLDGGDKWDGGWKNPERSQNFKNTNDAGKGKYIAIDGSALTSFGSTISTPGKKIGATKTGALLVLHGMGHNADLNCGSCTLCESNNSSIMGSPLGIREFIKKWSYEDLFKPKAGRDDYRDALKSRYTRK